jgi:hypothetical protein
LESEEPAETQAYHSCAGYLVQRSGWGPLDSHLVFDCGGLGMLSGAHAHADALSVTLFSGGRELLADPGTFVYNCAPDWRNYFRSTRAHNTVTIDDRDQAEQGGTFHWKTKLGSRAVREFTPPGVEYVEGEHDGYRRMPQGVIHRRRLLYIPPDKWIIVDDFRGSGEHRFDFHYHFAPDVEVSGLQQDEAGIAVRAEKAGLRLRMFTSRAVTSAELIRGETSPITGWASRGYGEKQSCSTLRASLAGPVPAAAMTFLTVGLGLPPASPAGGRSFSDSDTGSEIRRLTVQSGSAIACSCEHHGFEDIAILSTGDSEMAVADFRMRGEFFWLRLESGVLKQVLAVRACSLDRGGSSIFRRSEPGPYFGVIDAGSKEKNLCVEFAGS